jgi:hypothetical protein
MNNADMQSDGSRSCFLNKYGDPYRNNGDDVIAAVCRAWGVRDVWWFPGSRPTITRDHRRTGLLLFPDGLWRFGSFGGLSGEPMAYCGADGTPGETGEIAHLTARLRAAERLLAAKKAEIVELRAEQDRLRSSRNK